MLSPAAQRRERHGHQELRGGNKRQRRSKGTQSGSASVERQKGVAITPFLTHKEVAAAFTRAS